MWNQRTHRTNSGRWISILFAKGNIVKKKRSEKHEQNCEQPWWWPLWVQWECALQNSQTTYQRTSKLACPGLVTGQQKVEWYKLLPKCISARSKAVLLWYSVMHCNRRHWHFLDNQRKSCWAYEVIFVIAWLKWSTFSLPNYCVPATRKIYHVSSQYLHQALSITNNWCARKAYTDKSLQAEASNSNPRCTVWCGWLKTKKSKIDWCSVVELQKIPLLLFLLHSCQLKACELQGDYQFALNSTACWEQPSKVMPYCSCS